MALDVTELQGMTPAELDNVTELQTRSDDGWQAIVTRVRDDVVEAAQEGRFDEGPRARYGAIHEIADSLVPAYSSELFAHLRIIGAAWSVDIVEARDYAALSDNWSMVTFGDGMEDAARMALYVAYRQAVSALVDTLTEHDDDDDDD